MFGTLLNEKHHDWKQGLKYLTNNILKNANYSDVLQLAKNFEDKNMKNRSITFKEPKMIDQLKMFKNKYEFNNDETLYDIEYLFLKHSRKCTLNDDVLDLLDYLSNYNNSLYVMSNTIYSSLSIKRLLKDFNIEHYFEEIYTSADFGYRKPSKKFFDYVIKECTDSDYYNTEDIIYIGDSFEKDVLGATSVGFHTILLSKEITNNNHIITEKYIKKHSLLAIKQYIIDNFIYLNALSDDYSVTDGIGNRLVIYFQGCNLHCFGCHNEITWDITKGKRKHINAVTVEILKRLNKYSKNITISGGEPLYQEKPLINMLDILNNYDINICLYTGHEFDTIPQQIKDKVHYIKSGSFNINKKTTTIGFYGSSNQIFWKKGEENVWEKMNLK